MSSKISDKHLQLKRQKWGVLDNDLSSELQYWVAFLDSQYYGTEQYYSALRRIRKLKQEILENKRRR